MSISPTVSGRSRSRLALFVLVTVVFSLACWQATLYYSNQNQYFLHGLARAGLGHLAEDWLANTLDPTLVFSGLVAFTARHLHPWAFYLEYALLQGVYAFSLLGLFVAVAGERPAAGRWLAFLALLVAVHAAVVRWASFRWLGQDYPWYLQSGVAGQYTLGAMFQPSVFGVLLVAAVCLFARDRPYLAATCAALAATVHSTYLLHAALLVLGFQVALLVEGEVKRALGVGALALALVMPVTLYVLLTFRPSSEADFAAAQAILVNFRIPHHARIDLWLDQVAWLQIAWIALGIALARPWRLTIALAVAAGVAALLTLAQAATGSHTLALLFPWRLSAILVPVATAVILSRLVLTLPDAVEGMAARAVCAALVVLCVAGGVWIGVGRRGFHASDEELPLLDFARRTAQSGDVYFLPVNVPDLVATTRGSRSSDFRPLVEKKHGTQVIPIDLQRFRLHALVPTYIDFKSIPYKDTEVLEWRERIRLAQEVQGQLRAGAGETATALDQLRRRGVTHLVLPAGQPLGGDGATAVYEDEHYRVYRLSP